MSCYDLDGGYDLCACLEHNPQQFAYGDIDKILAVWEGENDGDDWRWVLSMKDGRFAFLQSGCDYTGWDCQSWATSAFADSAEKAAMLALGDDLPVGTCLDAQGFHHMLNMITGEYMANRKEVYESLLRQLTASRDATWREKKDVELGVRSGH